MRPTPERCLDLFNCEWSAVQNKCVVWEEKPRDRDGNIVLPAAVVTPQHIIAPPPATETESEGTYL